MVAPLIMAAIALGKQKLDDDQAQAEAWNDYIGRAAAAKYNNEATIRAMRAARAGDSGYAQRAASMILNQPQYQPAASGMQDAALKAGGALLQARENEEAQAKSQARWDAFRKSLANQPVAGGGDRSLLVGEDDDLIDPWGG